MRIDDQYCQHLQKHGYALVPGFLNKDELAAARKNFLRYFPTPAEFAVAPERYESISDDPEHQQIEFPFAGDTLNNNSTHPDLIDVVERLLGTREVLLSQAAIWAKYAGLGDLDQTMHLDYEGNTLVVPRDEGAFRQVNMILYYTDVTEDLGPTAVVPLEDSRSQGVWPPFRPRDEYPELYRAEKLMLAKAGDLFIFAMGTFHRATGIRADFGSRFTHHFVWRAAAYPFAGYQQWSRFGEEADLARFIEHATPRQRDVIGFPPPGHPYWNDATLAGVAERYPEMDMTPYRR